LAKIAYADVEHCPANQVDGLKPGAVQQRRDVGHHRGGHARRPQALRRVTQSHIDELNGLLVWHQLVAIRKSLSIHRVWISARSNSFCCSRCAWNGTVVATPET